ncbi:MAG: DUF2934 domain-containing protein [Acidobacteriota bacterium]
MTTTGPTRRRRGGTTQIMPASESADTAGSTDSVALLAYQLFLACGATHGHDLDDWLMAESQLRAGSGVKKRKTSSRRA